MQGILWGAGGGIATLLFCVGAETWAAFAWVAFGGAAFLRWAYGRRAMRLGAWMSPMVLGALALFAVCAPVFAGCGVPGCCHEPWPLPLTVGWGVVCACFLLGETRWMWARGVLAWGALWGALTWMGHGYKSYDAAQTAVVALAVWPVGAALLIVKHRRASVGWWAPAFLSLGFLGWLAVKLAIAARECA